MSATELRMAADSLRAAEFTEHFVAEITDGANTTVAYRSPHGGFYLDRQGPDLGTPRQGVNVTRTFHEHIRPGLALALADLLDAQAEHVASHDCEAHCAYPDGSPQCVAALAVAREINGGA